MPALSTSCDVGLGRVSASHGEQTQQNQKVWLACCCLLIKHANKAPLNENMANLETQIQ